MKVNKELLTAPSVARTGDGGVLKRIGNRSNGQQEGGGRGS